MLMLYAAQSLPRTSTGRLAAFFATQTPTPTATPLYAPTRTPLPSVTAPPATPMPTVTPVPLVLPTDTPGAIETSSTELEPTTAAEQEFRIPVRERFGGSGKPLDVYTAQSAGLNVGSFITWDVFRPNEIPADVSGWQMVRVSPEGILEGNLPLEEAVRASPGGYFVIGNEPDVEVQDNTPADRYAEIYHEAYTTIKSVDPTAQVAIAGVASPTPLRLAYLDQVLDHYEQTFGEQMPIDIWTMHIYVLREERDSWGVGIPTGMDDVDTGQLYEIDDHNDVEIANGLLDDFRRWMAERGYQDKPLAITEFGILLPADYGFPEEVVANYMTELVNYYLTARGETGYPADDDRLVQWWFWFSILDTDQFQVSDLVNQQTFELTRAGERYAEFIEQAEE